MFENLTDKLQSVFDRLATKGKLTEGDVNAAMREVRLALLEADVNYKVVKEFVEKVKARAVGVEVMQSLTPAQTVVKIVHEELIDLLGKPAPLNTSGAPPHVIMLVGLQGAGKTTMAAKLALRLKKDGQRPLLVAADIYRPAAIKQLEVLGKQIDVPVYTEGTAVCPPPASPRTRSSTPGRRPTTSPSWTRPAACRSTRTSCRSSSRCAWSPDRRTSCWWSTP